MDAFSRDEVEFLGQGGLFAWKERLTRRIKSALESLHEALSLQVAPEALLAPEHMDWTRWQVVRGERFGDRPYAYLDFPQYFSRDTKFTYRSMFWWGEGVFFAMILQGSLLERYRTNLEASYRAVADRELTLSLSETPWEWNVTGPRVLPVRMDTADAVIAAARERPVLKLQRVLSLEALGRPDAIVQEGLNTFETLRPVVARTGS